MAHLWIPHFDCPVLRARDVTVGPIGQLDAGEIGDDVLMLQVLWSVMRHRVLEGDGGL